MPVQYAVKTTPRILYLLLSCTVLLFVFTGFAPVIKIDTYLVNPQQQHLQMFYKNGNSAYRSIDNLKEHIQQQNKKLLFAMNGGMYQTDNSPLGLYIENGVQITGINKRSGSGNFYMNPNGVLYITTAGKAAICPTNSYPGNSNVKYATQSGPMLVIDDSINPLFKSGSANLNIRNGVGLLPGNKLLFAISAQPINFYDFADFFKKAGCRNALYLDGYVSRAYIPEKGRYDEDGDFGVLIAVTKP